MGEIQQGLMWPLTVGRLLFVSPVHAIVIGAAAILPAYYLYGSPMGKPAVTLLKGYGVASVGAYVGTKAAAML